METKYIVTAFVDAINTRDRAAICQLMVSPSLATDQASYIDIGYQIQIEHILCDCSRAVLIGHAKTPYGTIPAVWVAELCGQRIMDWRVYFDGTLDCAN